MDVFQAFHNFHCFKLLLNVHDIPPSNIQYGLWVSRACRQISCKKQKLINPSFNYSQGLAIEIMKTRIESAVNFGNQTTMPSPVGGSNIDQVSSVSHEMAVFPLCKHFVWLSQGTASYCCLISQVRRVITQSGWRTTQFVCTFHPACLRKSAPKRICNQQF